MRKISELVSHIMSAVNNCSLYSAEHPLVGEFVEKALGLLQELYVGDQLRIVTVGDSLIVNETPCRERTVHICGLMKKLKKKKIEEIIIKKAVNAEEFKNFVAGLVSGGVLTSSPNISVGIVEVRFDTSCGDPSAILENGKSKVRDVFHGVLRFKRLDTVGLEDAVMDFMAALKKEMNILRIVGPVKAHDEYTYVHETNVAVLTLFQAESLGLKGEHLHDIGLSALLHDVGKVFVPAEVINKPTKLNAEDWTEMQKHPFYGAWYLSRIQEVPPLASVVAFEHHMKFDGTGYPETKRISRKQHIVSQMVAIADFFDALRTVRPYKKALEVSAVSGLLSRGAGTDFNPFLVERFLVSLKQIGAVYPFGN